MKVILDGSLRHPDQPAVPVTSRGLMYGEGCFETFRTYENHTFLLGEHLERLQAGLAFLGVSLPDDLERDNFQPLLKKLLHANDLRQKNAVVRLQVWREGERGYNVSQPGQLHYAVTATQCPDHFEHPRLVTVDTRRIPSVSLPSDFKFSNGINYIVAAREAEQQGGDDALMQTTDGWISETTKANIFWMKDDQVFTPSADCDILPGITRNISIKLSRELDMTVNEGEYLPEHLNGASAVWICNSVRELLPVKGVNRLEFGEHEFLTRLRSRFREFRNQHIEKL